MGHPRITVLEPWSYHAHFSLVVGGTVESWLKSNSREDLEKSQMCKPGRQIRRRSVEWRELVVPRLAGPSQGCLISPSRRGRWAAGAGLSTTHPWYPNCEDPVLMLSGRGCTFSRPPGSLCYSPCHAQQSSAAHQSRIHYPPLYGVCKSDPHAHNKRTSSEQYISAVISPPPHTSETFPWFTGWQRQRRDGPKGTGATNVPFPQGSD